MKPVSGSEQGKIGQIVEFFRTMSMPMELAGELYRIYALPHVFEIKFYSKGGESASLPKLGKCALTNMSVKYGGDRYSTFSDGSPVQTDLTLSFVEIELQTKNNPRDASAGSMLGGIGSIASAGLTAAQSFEV